MQCCLCRVLSPDTFMDHNPPLPQQNVSVPEMGRFQRQIVDNSLEEGQFQSGIDALDQLRSPDHKPSVYATYHPTTVLSDAL